MSDSISIGYWPQPMSVSATADSPNIQKIIITGNTDSADWTRTFVGQGSNVSMICQETGGASCVLPNPSDPVATFSYSTDNGATFEASTVGDVSYSKASMAAGANDGSTGEFTDAYMIAQIS